jgi:hypothetical protein
VSKRKTVSQQAVEQKVEDGATVKQAAEEVYASPTTALDIRKQLGLDSEELRETVGKIIAKRYIDAELGKFPTWIEAIPDDATKAKLKLDYMKTYKTDLSTAFITKTEKRIVETEDTRHRSDADIEFRLKYGKWPEELVIDQEDSGSVN